jgi:transcriptional regulator with XRE-family HTH domain
MQSETTPGDVLASLMRANKLGQSELANLVGTSQAQISRLAKNERPLSKEWAVRIAPHLGVSPIDLLFPEQSSTKKLPIIGRVGATTDGIVTQDPPKGSSFGEIIAPLGARGSEVALEVRGHSLGVYAPDGSLILYDHLRERPKDSMLGEVCVVELGDGRVLVKRLRRGSRRGSFDLEGLGGETMQDQPVSWAAVVLIVVHPKQANRLRIG